MNNMKTNPMEMFSIYFIKSKRLRKGSNGKNFSH